MGLFNFFANYHVWWHSEIVIQLQEFHETFQIRSERKEHEKQNKDSPNSEDIFE